MRTEPIRLEHLELLEPRFNKLALDISEYTFANIYLFRTIHRYEVVFGKDVYIKGVTRDGFKYLMPTSSIELIDMSDLLACLQGCDFLFPIPESWAPHFDAKNFQITSHEQDSDYFFSVEKMSTYPGRNLSGRRNLVKQFNELYPDHRSIELTSQNIADAFNILEIWQQNVHLDAQSTDYAETHEALKLLDTLKLKGHISYAEGKPVGFILGEPLNPQVYLFQFAKAHIEFKGVYQYLYQEFAKSLANNFQMINLEQDMGEEELKHAKRAYQPDHLVPKLRISLCKPKV